MMLKILNRPLSRLGYRPITNPPSLSSFCLLLTSLLASDRHSASMASKPGSSSSSALARSAYVIEPSKPHHNTIIWLHGLGDSSDGFKHLFNSIKPPNTRIVLPNAPIQPITINGGASMRAWYDIISLDRDNNLLHPAFKHGIQQSQVLIEELLESESKLVPSNKILLGGFSQGGAMAIYTGLHYSKPLAGIISSSGYVLLTDSYPSHINPANNKTPVLALHGQDDPMVPVDFAQESYQKLQSHAVKVELQIEPDIEHTISNDHLVRIRDFISSCFS